MTKEQKIAAGFGAIFFGIQTAAGVVLLNRCEELEKKYDRVRMAGIYALSILERENINLNEFDSLAFEALRPDPKDDKGKT